MYGLIIFIYIDRMGFLHRNTVAKYDYFMLFWDQRSIHGIIVNNV